MELSPSPVGSLISWKPHGFLPGQPALLECCSCLCLSWAQCCSGRISSRAGSEGAVTARADNFSWPRFTSSGRWWLSHSSCSILLHPILRPKRIFLNKCTFGSWSSLVCSAGGPAKSMFCCLEILENKEHFVGRTQYKQRHENYLEN